MKIELTKISNTHHSLRCTRDDGSVEESELESKTFVVHDFTHLAYEQEARLTQSFWGRVASGETFMTLREDIDHNELLQTEMIVGPLQSVMQGQRPPEAFVAGVSNLFMAHSATLPSHLTTELIQRTQERFRRLYGEWQALPFGDSMTIDWRA